MKKKKAKNWLVKSYKNFDFMDSHYARPVRVLSELLEPYHRFRKHNLHNTVVFFGSARTLPKSKALKNLKAVEAKLPKKTNPSPALASKYKKAKSDLAMSGYYEDACKLSEKLTAWFNTLEKKNIYFTVCSGGGPGIMEAANKGAKKAGGKSIGMNISLPMEQWPNIYQTKDISFKFHYFFIRKFWFFYPSKAMVVFPGGFGTMDEFFELLTLIQTEKTQKKLAVVVFGKEFWNKLIDFNVMLESGTIDENDLKLFKMTDSVDEAFKYLQKEITKNYINKAAFRKRMH